MTLHIEYITDRTGKTKSVIIPNNEWEQFKKEYIRMKNKLEVLSGLKNALEEVRLIQKRNKKVRTLSDFLNEV